MTKEPFIAHSELTNEIYIVADKEKYLVTEQAIKAVKAIKALEQQSEDAISREDAIMCMTGEYLADKEYKPEDIISEHIKRLRALPSVTPMPKTGHWIPVSERLPEEFQRVLVTIVNYKGDKVVRVSEYYNRVFRIKENHERWEVGEKGLLAWKPLPEPYEPQESEDKE